jgi:Zn-finger nucleic acid-binding protein
MKCPVCPDSTLAISDRQGIEVDYCPKCRGVWLDRGELDKLVSREARAAPPEYRDDTRRPRQDHYDGRRKSWLSEIFD